MPANDRNNPQRQHSSDSDFSLVEFMQQYPDDAACLDKLWRDKHAPDGHHAHCPKCDRERKFHRTTTRASYTCDTCGLHVHPMAGTIFEKSTTSLQLWFYALYLVASTRCGISAKQLERELGVTYKTAHRMMKRIRMHLMNDEGDGPLWGDVEVDETSVRGKWRGPKRTHTEAARWRERQPSVPLRGSSGTSRPGCEARTSTCPPSTSSPIGTSTRSATTTATMAACSTRC